LPRRSAAFTDTSGGEASARLVTIETVTLLAVGVSHHHLGSEHLAELESHAPHLTSAIAASEAVTGAVVVATCNRFEAYLEAPAFHPGVEAVIAALHAAPLTDSHAVVEALDVHPGESAIEHLFSVACGLDSMVVGEAQVVGQVRQAFADATDAGRTTPALHRLFQDALATAKTVASSTELGGHGRSIASVGLDLIEARHFPLAGSQALVLGTGSYAGVVVAALAERGCTDITVHSRTGRAASFARTHPVIPVPEHGLFDALARADLVVTCSGASTPTLTDALVRTQRRYAARVLPILDLSTGGELGDGVAELDEADVFTLDDIGRGAPAEHLDTLLAAQDVVDRAVAAYLHVEGGRTAAPAITAMRAYVSAIIAREAEVAARRYPPEVADAIDRSLRRVSGALLHAPSVRAAELARTGDLQDYTHAMATLFGIVVEADPW
jgi:glutamyl-tRNA reductase